MFIPPVVGNGYIFWNRSLKNEPALRVGISDPKKINMKAFSRWRLWCAEIEEKQERKVKIMSAICCR